MPPREWQFRIGDILNAIAAIGEYTAGLDFASFSADRRTLEAVLYNFVVIGEAANNVPEDVRNSPPEIPWDSMRKMRNVGVHVYFGIKADILWDTIHNDPPPLVPALHKLLEPTS